MSALAPEVRASYVVIIDKILAGSDLNTVSAKQIRRRLQEQVNYDVTPQKEAINKLIKERFDKVLNEQASEETNGHDGASDSKAEDASSTNGNVSHKRKSESDIEAEISEVASSPPPPKKKRKPEVDADAALAAKLQAEENSRARPTRGGATRKAAPAKKKSPKKTSSKVRAEDDSDLEDGSTEEKKVNRTGAFHKPLLLSEPLSALFDGETKLSRPQCVKRIWQYVREHDLQDPKDRRQIRCDDALRAVFKSDKVHMFTMNKILNQNLYDLEA